MEDNKTSSTSDRDKQMMGRFESYADKNEKSEKDKKKAKKTPGLFEQPKETDEAKDDKKDVTESWFKTDKAETEDDKTPEAESEDQAENPEVMEAENSVEELDDIEVQEVIERYVDAQAEDVKAEVAASEPDSPEEAESVANAALLENIKETGSVEAGYAETLDELGLEEADEETEEAELGVETEPESPEDDIEEDQDDTPIPAVAAPPAVPPIPPLPPVPGPSAGAPVPPNPFAAPASINRMPSAPNSDPNQLSVDPSRRRQRAGDMLVGGILGYLLGRRRGRIKTEAQMKPVQEKLETQVRDLHDQIAEKETKIRKLAAAKAQRESDALQPLLQRRLENREQQELKTQQTAEAMDQGPDYLKAKPERFGQLLIPKVELSGERFVPNAETMSLPELLDVAANIKIEDVSLKRMFETGRLDAVGLRRVVQEYLRGDKFERVLADNLKNIERYEQDPLASAAAAVGAASAVGAAYGTQTFSSETLQPLSPVPGDQPSVRPASTLSPQALAQQKRQAAATGISIGLAVAVIVLILLALFV